jgi:hypothetical protein
MKERGILFSGAMVRALLAGTKAQTRRVVRSNLGKVPPVRISPGPGLPDVGEYWCEPGGWIRCPYGTIGDRLWVRETWCLYTAEGQRDAAVRYRAGGEITPVVMPEQAARTASGSERWRPSIHMPRWASRITLQVTEVRVQRLQDISEEDARAEGITGPHDVGYPAYRVPDDSKPRYSCAVAAYEALWDSINGDRAPWASSPWVWAVSFRRVQP